MDIYDLLIVSLALSLDAFGVALSIGLDSQIKSGNKARFAFSFGFFQFLFSILGAYIGELFNTYIAAVPEIIGGALISTVGVLMIKEGFEKKDEDILLNWKMYYVLGISVSIDAMVIGFTVLNSIPSRLIVFKYTIIIGITTLIISSIAFFISKYLRRIELVSKYADYIGGIILFIFGLKMMLF